MDFGALTLSSWRPGSGEVEVVDGAVRLRAEIEWKLEGPADQIDAVADALPGHSFRPTRGLLQLSFGNSVGYYDVPHLGRLEVRSGKWGSSHFDRMLRELKDIAASLPFAAASGSALPFDRSVPIEQDVLYHAFVYLRHILTEVDDETNLARAYAIVLADPHQRLVTDSREVRPELARSVSPRSIFDLVSGRVRLTPAGPASDTPLARALNGRIPERVREEVAHRHVDTAENRFARAFLGQIRWVLEQMQRAVSTRADSDLFARRIRLDCAQLERLLAPIVGHRFWREIGSMIVVPEASVVLQRRRGYRHIFEHFAKLRLASRVPLSSRDVRRLLEAKDIATLYELWCYFKVVDAVREQLGRPDEASSVRYDDFGPSVEHGYRVCWPGGVEVVYNPRFRRTDGGCRSSYSVPLRPDIAIILPRCDGWVVHLLDAKFKLQTLADVIADGQDDDPDAGGAATFKRADLYKMHTYRDAIPAAQTVWVLYPGTDMRFFDESGDIVAGGSQLGPKASGVGAAPMRPEEGGDGVLREVVAALICNRHRED